MKAGIIAPLALLLLGAASPSKPQAQGETCGVFYSRILLGSYEQSTVKRTLPALMIEGSAAPGTESFDFFDDDGFLTLTMLVSAWQASGQGSANIAGEVQVDRSDLALLEYASRVGSAYFQAVLDYAATRKDLTPQQVIEVDQAKAQLALFQRAGTQAKASLGAADGKTILPRGFIPQLGAYLENLRPTAPNAFNSRYNDMVSQKTSRLCDPAGASTLLGKILCDRDLGTGAKRAESYCASTSDIASPAHAMVCEVHQADGKPSLANCTDGAGGTSVPAPSFGN